MKRGFTLIELLVVIAIIGMLSSVVLASLNTARGSARDARRLEDLRQLQTAMELYYGDHGMYPCENASACAGQSVNANGKIGEGSGLDTLLAPYIGSIPVDPLGPGDSTHYYYYDARQSCGGVSQPIAVIFARAMENTSGNSDKTCTSWGGEGGAGSSATHHIYIGPSPG